jgi:hypothetical protein
MDIDRTNASNVIQPAAQAQEQQQQRVRRKKKCHGNQKDRRLRKRWRNQGLDEITIQDHLNQRKQAQLLLPHRTTTTEQTANTLTVTNISSIVRRSKIISDLFLLLFIHRRAYHKMFIELQVHS